jgi:hypothetical protein
MMIGNGLLGLLWYFTNACLAHMPHSYVNLFIFLEFMFWHSIGQEIIMSIFLLLLFSFLFASISEV